MYMFLEDSDTLVLKLTDRYIIKKNYYNNNDLFGRWRKAYDAYYGRYYENGNAGVGSAGEQDEFSTLAVNHLRNITKHTIALTTQNRLVFDCQSSNSDVSSRNSTIVGNAVLDQFFYEKRFEAHTRQALELSLIFGTAFLAVTWDPFVKLIGQDAEGTPIWSGAPNFSALSPLDVMMEPFRHDYSSQNWIVTREIANRWDLMSLHPDRADEIEALPKITDLQSFYPNYNSEEDNVYLYRAYHKSTPALPTGRYTVFCDAGIVLSDDKNPYPDLPVFCIRPDVQYGSAYGHAPIFDLLPIQESINLLDSSIISNQSTFAVQNVVASKKCGISVTDLAGGLKLIEADPDPDAPNGGFPTPMNLCQTPPEIFQQRMRYVSDMESVSGINSAARGQPDSALVSGTAIALVATQANTYNSSIESGYVALCEESAFFMLQVLHLFMREEEILTLTGKASAYAVKTFKGDDLAAIRKVRITLGNPLAKTLSGKLEIATQLLQQGMLKSPDEFLAILHDGALTPILEDSTAQEAYIRIENEQLARGEKPEMNALDNHQKHISSHMTLLWRPEVRSDPTISQAVMDHIVAHTDQLEQMATQNPMMLSLALEQPLQLPQPHPESGFGGPPPPAGAPPHGGPAPEQGGPAPDSQSAQSALENGPEGVAASAQRRAEKLQGAANAEGHIPAA